MDQTIERCPLCINGNLSDTDVHAEQYDNWLQCDVCSTWYHSECLKISAKECDSIETYHCPSCTKTHGPTTYKPKRRKSNRDHIKLNYADLNEGKTGDEKIWGKLLNAKTFATDCFPRYKGEEVTLDLLRRTGMKEPFIVEKNEGLGMQMPPNDINVYDIAHAVGENHPVEVIDVATQSEQPGWTMGRWAAYYHSAERDRIRNVISLEISGTDFAASITRPKIVRDLDWIDQAWPSELKPKEYPKVQLYCLMGTRDSYTDFHIDFGGSSVFYHIIKGSKTFYFIEPSSRNLKKYQKWTSSPDQTTTFFGDEVKQCTAVHLKAGNTMIIPTGWIHAVYTPEDAIVIGGNFLHGLNIPVQLRIDEIEKATNVPSKFRFPFFKTLNWYAAAKYCEILKERPVQLSLNELQGILKLAHWLGNDIAKITNTDSQSSAEERKSLRAMIPLPFEKARDLPVHLITSIDTIITEKYPPTPAAKPEVEPPTKTTLKVKLKVGSNKSTEPQEKQKLVNTKKTDHPKITLKLSAKKVEEDRISDDEYVAEEADADEYMEDDDAIDAVEDIPLDSDDDDYEEAKPSASRKRRNNRKPASRSRVKETYTAPAYDSASSSEDDLGTSKKIKRTPSRPSLSSLAASKKATSTTARQRLLERIQNFRK